MLSKSQGAFSINEGATTTTLDDTQKGGASSANVEATTTRVSTKWQKGACEPPICHFIRGVHSCQMELTRLSASKERR